MSTVEITPIESINFAPETEREEIIQNVATILATIRYSVPYDREFGINPDYLDSPNLMIRSKLIADVVAKVKKYEPRAKVISVTFNENAIDGIIKPNVKVDIDG